MILVNSKIGECDRFVDPRGEGVSRLGNPGSSYRSGSRKRVACGANFSILGMVEAPAAALPDRGSFVPSAIASERAVEIVSGELE